MDKSLLCLSWLNGHFKAATVNRGTVVTPWDRPGMVADFSNFKQVLAESIDHTRSGARQVAIVLAHPRHIHQIQEMPPIKGSNLVKFLSRRVPTVKTFDGEAAWSWQPALPTKTSQAVLLHVFPQNLVDQLTTACRDLDLQLVRLLPTTAVLAAQLKTLSLGKDELALVAAETGSSTTIVIGTGDGRVCLGRVLRGRWDQQIDSVAVDLGRSIKFAEQQSGLVVGRVYLFGAEAATHLPALQNVLQLPVQVSPVAYSPNYWEEQAAQLPEKDDGNLISRQLREAPKRRRRLVLIGLILLALLVVAVAAFSYLGIRYLEGRSTLAKEKAALERMQGRRMDLQQQLSEVTRKREFARVVLDERPPPAPAWFLGYLSEAVPEELLVTDLRVIRTNASWWVSMMGIGQPITNPSPAAVIRQAQSALTNRLVSGPFHLKLSRHGVIGRVETTDQGKRTNNTFVVEGMIQ